MFGEIAKLPRWRLDLDDDSIIFDPETLTITDRNTDESFSLRGWNLGVTGIAGTDRGGRHGAYGGATNLSVSAENPPTIGNWYKSSVA
jgi:hypothetical protein